MQIAGNPLSVLHQRKRLHPGVEQLFLAEKTVKNYVSNLLANSA